MRVTVTVVPAVVTASNKVLNARCLETLETLQIFALVIVIFIEDYPEFIRGSCTMHANNFSALYFFRGLAN